MSINVDASSWRCTFLSCALNSTISVVGTGALETSGVMFCRSGILGFWNLLLDEFKHPILPCITFP